MRIKGKLTSWNDDKGFGFITPMLGGKQIFIHINAFNNRHRRPEINQIITFTLSSDQDGRPCAQDATISGDKRSVKSSKQPNGNAVKIVFIFITGITVMALTGRLPLQVVIFYGASSLLTFILYTLDKAAAKKGAWRVQESTLHLLSLACGWPGALIAQQRLRHKSKKQSFRRVFWVTMILNIAVLLWLCTPDGAALLSMLLGNK